VEDNGDYLDPSAAMMSCPIKNSDATDPVTAVPEKTSEDRVLDQEEYELIDSLENSFETSSMVLVESERNQFHHIFQVHDQVYYTESKSNEDCMVNTGGKKDDDDEDDWVLVSTSTPSKSTIPQPADLKRIFSSLANRLNIGQ
jgi:hypothetical protein